MCQCRPRCPVKEYSCLRIISIIRKYLVSPIFWNIIFSSSILRALTAGRPRSVNICAVCNLSQICTVFTRKEQCKLNITILHNDHKLLLYLQIILPKILVEQRNLRRSYFLYDCNEFTELACLSIYPWLDIYWEKVSYINIYFKKNCVCLKWLWQWARRKWCNTRK